jgi:hypothetical protein
MSMIGKLARVSVQQLESLHGNPESIMQLLYPDNEPEVPSEPGFFGRLFGRKVAPAKAVEPVEALNEDDAIDLDKAWHSLHFLLNGQAWEGAFPQGFLVSCGKEVGAVDVGYGPARSFTPEEVAGIAAFLDAQDETKLRAAVNPAAMREAEVYCGAGPEDTLSDEEWEYLVGAFRNAREFVRETAARKMALLVYIN